MTSAICYTATPGYLYQSVVSAIQARSYVEGTVDVYIVFVAPDTEAARREAAAFAAPCGDHRIRVLEADVEDLDGSSPLFARLFLDHFLPESVDEILYLDGDTQVVADLMPLVAAAPSPGYALLAASDPMVFIQDFSSEMRDRIRGWWASSGIDAAHYSTYVNSGVLRISRSTLASTRPRALEIARGSTLHFADQDAINLALQGQIEIVSMRWNFPAFLLGTPIARDVEPTLIHFMSNPRPWQGSYRPWGKQYVAPYDSFDAAYPACAVYRQRLDVRGRVKYLLLQLYKARKERPLWCSDGAREAARRLDQSSRAL